METYALILKGINLDTYNNLLTILELYNKDFTLQGLQEVGIKGLYDFDKIPQSALITARNFEKLLTAVEKRGAKLEISEEEFEQINFDILNKFTGNVLKQGVLRALVKHNCLKDNQSEDSKTVQVAEKEKCY